MILSEHAKEILNNQEQMLKDAGIISPYVFPNDKGELLNPNLLWKKWDVCRKEHGISSSLHEMRHTFISVAKADIPEQILKQAVGHSKSMDTFGIYGHKVDGEMNKFASTVDNIFDAILNNEK